MITQGASLLLEAGREIRVALVAAGLRIAGLLTEEYPPPVVDGEPLFDYGKQVQHLIHELETAENAVVAAEDAHMKQEVRVSRLRSERDQKTEANYDKLLAARQGFDGLQGAKGGFETVFVSGESPRRPKRLLVQMAQSVTLLNDPAVEPRDLKVAGFTIDYATVASDLETGMLDLRGTMDRLETESKIAEGTMLARRQTIDELSSTVIWAGRGAEGLFHRAGEHELAKRIRTSTKRPLRPSEEQAKEQQESGGEPPGDDSTATDPASQPGGGVTEPSATDSSES